ncbi:putative F-box/FBD/LRR-repeat protein At4g03220 [Trifolium pratense]|uniref:Uncharacterized protein n=1 Tax=Trifolium pratense TaxID=57577 RepID=A0ACB0IIT2_TRIPR|nr:putative F-box/FBD/LRR-repeat protein At4g03220 [Trifolium pratense]XP_045796850.1 putative F-box/FBD/LRR-repeat protein At4g03220 [Trifolium pratense]XP_045796851.1 putative F-box/FBD/LRR-repeat protein At4g03220 [Trifolium pratense]XP_045796852.1 putative F-box/FBD/LRR-repeat protein At4g03220 [Trifolium pratense]XP_045796853.1 putative F-box/FBD/LRR-repeat protein At4g03220 [Trifolium pratense]CAJ2631891.1 unnamed protein product [Trifolium pratense]
MKRCNKLKKIELPDSVMSYIFSMLSLKDLVKTSALSKQWIREWGLRTDLNFDLYNMFDYNTIQDLPKSIPSLPIFQTFHFQSEFATRLDQFMLHYQGAVIHSIRLNFPLGEDDTDVIDRLISKAITKGVKRIELLFPIEIKDFDEYSVTGPIFPYKLSLTLLSGTDSLTYLHLYNCWLAKEPADFSGLKNLTTIVMDRLVEDYYTHMLSQLFSECLQIEDATFKNCKLKWPIKITGPKLRHLNIINCGFGVYSPKMIDIDALNLSSFEFSGINTKHISVMAPRLLNVFWNAAVREKNQYPFSTIAKLTHIENLAMIITPSQIEELTDELVRFQNLRQLELFIEGAYDPNMDYFWILDIAMASQHLHKFSLTVRNLQPEHSHMVGFKRQKREYAGFTHNNLKYVKFCGCVCSINVIALASHLLRNASSLEKMTFSSCDKFYIGVGGWTNDSDGCCGFEHNIIHEMLKDEVNEQCQLIIL